MQHTLTEEMLHHYFCIDKYLWVGSKKALRRRWGAGLRHLHYPHYVLLFRRVVSHPASLQLYSTVCDSVM